MTQLSALIEMEMVLYGLGGLVLGLLVTYFILNARLQKLRERNIQLQATLESERQAEQEKLQSLKEDRQALNEAFASLSRQALKLNSEEFLKLAEENLKRFHEMAQGDLSQREKSIEHLVAPIKQALEKTEQQMQQIERERKEAYGSISNHLQSMALSQQELQQETRNLVQAFRRPEVRGQWGEMTLKRLAELAGMIEYCDFFEQENIDTEEGRMRPDMVIRMPGDREIVVDVKTPLDAYLSATESSDESERQAHMKRHTRNLRQRITELSSKAYWDQFDSTLDFVVLFIPGEQFLNAALDNDHTIYEEALRKKVILSSPTNFIAILRTIAYSWRHEKLTENAELIKKQGEELYARLATFSEYLSKLGKSLNNSVDNFNKAVSSYDKRLLPGARKFTEMGITGKKEPESIDAIDKLSSTIVGDSDKET